MKIIEYKNIFLAIGMLVMVASLALIFLLGIRPGIDFTGGSLMEVSYSTRPDKQMLETKLDELSLGGYSLRPASADSGRESYMLRSRSLSNEERLAVETAMLSADESGEVTRFNSIGPVIGKELQEKAKWAVGLVLLVIVVYVAIAFLGVRWPVGSSVYGAITILSLLHDVMVPAALMAVLGYFYGAEADVLFVTALLAVLGYSVNDTIVIFDRVRENIIKYRSERKKTVNAPGGLKREEVTYTFKRPFAEIVGLSIEETMLRSINTSLTTGLALLALYFFGADVTKNFALVMLAGVAAGAYSSIFFASPLLVWYAERRDKKSATL